MENDLTPFEKKLLDSINFFNKTKYTYKNLLEWSSSKAVVERNLQEGELMYEACSCYIAINPNPEKP